MGTYAADTSVSVERSRAELEKTVSRYGANAFGYAWEDGRAVVQFRAGGRFVRFVLPMPLRDDFDTSPGGRARTAVQTEKAWEQAQRQRWRALNLVVKAKLEAVEAGIATFDEEFMAHIVLPDGQTVGDFMGPQVEKAYAEGVMPTLLPPMPKQLGRGRAR